MKWQFTCIFAFFISFLIYCQSLGRQIEAWTYGRLLQESDAVVVAAVSSIKPARDTPPDQLKIYQAVAEEVNFAVEAVLKGKVDGSITLLHFNLPGNPYTTNGPMLLRFEINKEAANSGRTESERGDVASLGTPNYLLFLKRMKDGRYEPVFGQYDPRLSVREVRRPAPPAAHNESTKKP